MRFGAGRVRLLSLALACLLPAGMALGQELADPEAETDGVEITRDPDELRTELRVADRDLVNTALIFTNAGNRPARVDCVGFNRNGVPVGKIWLRVPPRGVRHALASDFTNGADFAGSARCVELGRVVGSAVLLAPLALTDLKVRQAPGVGGMFFPVIAAY